jgi:cytosine/adenosine deaminase-related metal-dependent hydrolase
MHAPNNPTRLDNARLPRWLLPSGWPAREGAPALAHLALHDGRVQDVRPMGAPTHHAGAWKLDGAPVLPGFVDAHTHLDKAFTLPRMKNVQPGLLGAIDAMLDVRQRLAQRLAAARRGRGARPDIGRGCHRLGAVHRGRCSRLAFTRRGARGAARRRPHPWPRSGCLAAVRSRHARAPRRSPSASLIFDRHRTHPCSTATSRPTASCPT